MPNLVTVPVGANGKVALFNSSAGSAQLIADVTGYYVTGTPATAGSFKSLSPARLLDTRNSGAVGANSTVSFQVAGANGIPASVAAVVFNLTVTQAKSLGFVTAYASGATRPNASNLNFSAGRRSRTGHGPGRVRRQGDAVNSSSGTSQLIADVAGYYLPGTPTATGAFKAVGPTRILDTRNTEAGRAGFRGVRPGRRRQRGPHRCPGSRLQPHRHLAQVLRLHHRLPERFSTAQSVQPELLGRTDGAEPGLGALGSDGKVALFNRSSGSSQLVADLAGYFLP